MFGRLKLSLSLPISCLSLVLLESITLTSFFFSIYFTKFYVPRSGNIGSIASIDYSKDVKSAKGLDFWMGPCEAGVGVDGEVEVEEKEVEVELEG